MAAFLNKDTESNSQESKTDKSTFWKFRFWYFSYCPPDKFDLPFSFRHTTYWFSTCKFNSYLAIIIVKKQEGKFLSSEKKLLEIVWDV